MNLRHARGNAQGFTLVEILVGLLMGMIAMIVVMQVFALSESRKRSTTGGADATTNAAAALYLIEREVKMAGWGLDTALYMGQATKGQVDPSIPGCTTVNTYCKGDASCGGVTGSIADFSLASVLIVDGAAGVSDLLRVRFFGNPDESNYAPAVSGAILANELDPTDTTIPRLRVSSNFGCRSGDLILVSAPSSTTSTCTLMQVSGAPGKTPGMLTLPHKSTAPFNNPLWDTIVASTSLPTDPQGDNGNNFGATAVATCFSHPSNGAVFERSYSVDAGKSLLLRTDNTGKDKDGATVVVTGETVASGIVDLQAQYGVANDGKSNVTKWVDATGDWSTPVPKAGTKGLATSGRLQNIKAVRISLLARSTQYEKPSAGAGGACDATSGTSGTPGNTDSWSTWATFKTGKFPADWQCYRYRAFEIVLPLRNVIWANL